MPLQFNYSTIELDGITSILVSDIQPDQSGTDYYVRVMTFFDVPTSTMNAEPVLILKLYGGSQANNDQTELEIQTPKLEF